MRCHYNLFQHLMGTLHSNVLARNTDIVVKPFLRHKPHVYVAPVVRLEDNSGPTAAVQGHRKRWSGFETGITVRVSTV